MNRRDVVILGSTGSIGTQALDIVERSPELELVGLSAERSWEAVVEQARATGVKRIALADADAAARAAEAWTDGEVLAGAEDVLAHDRGTPREIVFPPAGDGPWHVVVLARLPPGSSAIADDATSVVTLRRDPR